MLQQRPFNPTLENARIPSHPLAPAQIVVVLAHTWREERRTAVHREGVVKMNRVFSSSSSLPFLETHFIWMRGASPSPFITNDEGKQG